MMLPDRQPETFETQAPMAEPVRTVDDEDVPPTICPTLPDESENFTPKEAVIPTMYPSPPAVKSTVPKPSSGPKSKSGSPPPPSLPEPDLPETVDVDDSLSQQGAVNPRGVYWKRLALTYDPCILVQSGDVECFDL